MKQKKLYWYGCARLAIASFLLFLLGIIVSSGRLSSADESMVRLLYGMPAGLVVVFKFISQLGSVTTFIVISIAVLLLKKYDLAKRLIPSGILAIVLSVVAKMVYETQRPYLVFSDIVARVSEMDTYGFPSGHTALITVIAVSFMGSINKKYQYLLGAVVVLVAVSRIYLGVHTFTDVLGGMLVGYIAAKSVQIVINITERRKHKK